MTSFHPKNIGTYEKIPPMYWWIPATNVWTIFWHSLANIGENLSYKRRHALSQKYQENIQKPLNVSKLYNFHILHQTEEGIYNVW